MDPVLEVTDAPRPLPAGVDADAPPVVLAWRALAAEHRRRADERERRERDDARVRDALAAVAEQVHRLRRLAAGGSEHAAAVGAIAVRLEEALAGADVDVFAPEGEPYVGSLVDLFESVAQRPGPSADGPRVAEVIAPAVMVRGVLVRTGKAVIAVPAAEG